jgi:hypothetical protein
MHLDSCLPIKEQTVDLIISVVEKVCSPIIKIDKTDVSFVDGLFRAPLKYVNVSFQQDNEFLIELLSKLSYEIKEEIIFESLNSSDIGMKNYVLSPCDLVFLNERENVVLCMEVCTFENRDFMIMFNHLFMKGDARALGIDADVREIVKGKVLEVLQEKFPYSSVSIQIDEWGYG